MTMEQKTKKKKKEKVCPFNENLKCEDCRLFVTFFGGNGQKACAFQIMAGK